MNQKLNIEEISTSRTVYINNLGDPERRFNIVATVNYTDGRLRNVNDGSCTPAEPTDEPVAETKFYHHGSLQVHFRQDADTMAELTAINDFIADIAEL